MVKLNLVSLSDLNDKNGVSTFLKTFGHLKDEFECYNIKVNKYFTWRYSLKNQTKLNKSKITSNPKTLLIKLKKLKFYKFLTFVWFYQIRPIIISFKILKYVFNKPKRRDEIYFYNDIYSFYFSQLLIPYNLKNTLILHSGDDPLKDFFILFPFFKKTYILRNYLQHIKNFSIKNTSHVVTLSKSMSSSINKLEFNSKSSCVYNTCFLEKKLNIKEHNIINNDFINILSVGSLLYRKGFDLLINALNLLSPENKNKIKLKIAGDGSERKNLEELIKNNNLNIQVELLGNRNDIFELIKQCDLFCLTSREEGLPISIVESLSLSKPVLSTRVGAIPEVLDDKSCIFVDTNSIDIKKKLEFLICNKSELLSYGKEGNRIFNLKMSNQIFVKKYSKIFNSL